MKPETEALLQKWLKTQLWQSRISLFVWIMLLLSFFLGGWLTYTQLIPSIQTQLQNTQTLFEQVSGLSRPRQEQEDFFKNLEIYLQQQLEEKTLPEK